MDDWGFPTCGKYSFSLNEPYPYPAIDMVPPNPIQATRRLVYTLNIDMPSAKGHPASDTVVLHPDSRSVDLASSASGASCTQAPHLVASGASGHPSQYRVPSGHMQLSNPAPHASRLQPQHHRTSGFTTTPEYHPSLLGV